MTEPHSLPGGWTLEAYISHNEAMRNSQAKIEGERDRRYSEVKNAEEKALKIKEEADKTALGLQRDNQQYRDEKGNELRAQIERERGTYITRAEFKPVADYVTSQSGPRAITPQTIYAALAAVGILAAVWFGSHRTPTTPIVTTPAVTITTPAP